MRTTGWLIVSIGAATYRGLLMVSREVDGPGAVERISEGEPEPKLALLRNAG